MKKQQIIILAGCGLIAAMALFPPYLGVELRSGDNLRRFIGYNCILSPPVPKTVYQKLKGKPFDRWTSTDRYTSQIDEQRMEIQIGVVVLVVIGLAFAFKETEKPQQPPERDK